MKIITDGELNRVIDTIQEALDYDDVNYTCNDLEEVRDMLIAIRDKDYDINEHPRIQGVWIHKATPGTHQPMYELEDEENIL